MNNYERKRSKEIKQIVKNNRLRQLTYKQARRIWNWNRRFQWCSPCEDCEAFNCSKFKKNPPIVYCPNRR